MPQRLYQITLPGLDVRSDWRTVHDRMLDDFPCVGDVLATTINATVLVLYEGRPQVDRWLESITSSVSARAAGPRMQHRAS
jgi:hypothetical protein